MYPNDEQEGVCMARLILSFPVFLLCFLKSQFTGTVEIWKSPQQGPTDGYKSI
jgi:hypothetical protein